MMMMSQTWSNGCGTPMSASADVIVASSSGLYLLVKDVDFEFKVQLLWLNERLPGRYDVAIFSLCDGWRRWMGWMSRMSWMSWFVSLLDSTLCNLPDFSQREDRLGPERFPGERGEKTKRWLRLLPQMF